MVHEASGDCLVFNGEIYNYRELRRELEAAGARFKGGSDTEILLEALVRFGLKTFARLSGMYALAWYRARDNQLVLARDPLGIKPLYVAHTDSGLIFASETRAIIASGLVEPDINPAGVATMLAYGAVQHPLTVYKGICSFPRASFQVVSPQTAHPPQQFWTWPDADPGRSLESALEGIKETVKFAVRDHLVADVPVGIFLSSGLDSTVIAGLAAQSSSGLRSFTVGFEDQPDLSEFSAAAETAARFGLRHTALPISGTDALRSMEAWLNAMDQPSIDGMNTFVISEAVRSQEIKVALSGLGADELFGGYPSFKEVPRMAALLQNMRWFKGPMMEMAGAMLALPQPESNREKLRDMLRSDHSLEALYLHRRRLMSDRFLAQLGLDRNALGLDSGFMAPTGEGMIRSNKDAPFWAISQLESHYYQGNTLLRDSDTNSMAHGLELRVPFLDIRVVELLASLPDDVRLPAGQGNKPLLREAFASLLRPNLLNQPKMGFSLPIRRWMMTTLRERCETALAHLSEMGLLRRDGIARVWNAFVQNPESPMWSRAWALVVLGDFMRRQVAGK